MEQNVQDKPPSKVGRPPVGSKQRCIWMRDDEWEYAKTLGKGSGASYGLREALRLVREMYGRAGAEQK